ncbi:MAG: protein-disulfide reductase DsbD [Betaproteobacteria bacterium]|nr:protein-disulfide reductase DsbD [Betaproteobacteria bacterium]
MKLFVRLLALPLFLLASSVPAQFKWGGSSNDLLEPEKAFHMSAIALDPRNVELRFEIADGYYMYRERFQFSVEGPTGIKLGSPELPTGTRKKDEFFGEVETYRKDLRIRIPLERSVAQATRLQLKVTSQGCADSGVCYVPMDSRASIQLAALDVGLPDDARPGISEAPRSVQPTARISIFASDLDIARLFEGNLLLVLVSFFGFGLLLTFTPCVLPMVPILSGIIAGEGKRLNKMHALSLSLAYVLGMAITYALVGVAAAYSGWLLAAALQNAWVLGAFALVFVALALSMFGYYDLQLPHFLHHRLHAAHGRLKGGRLASVAVMGALSAVIVTPCVAAPLAGALLYISQTKNVLLGGAALFTMALGMGVPLVVVGVSEGALLPRAGAWVNAVKHFFGVLLLAVAIWIVAPVLPVPVVMFLWAALLVGSGVFLRALDSLPAEAPASLRLAKATGLIALVAGVALLIGALSGAREPLRPLAGLMGGTLQSAGPVKWTRVNSLGDLERVLRAAGKPVMLDFYADWCVSCKEMESFTFSDPRVRAQLDRMLLVQADVTANAEEHKRLLKRFSLFGPPGIIFFDAKGREIRGLRVIGYQDAERFLRTLALALEP